MCGCYLMEQPHMTNEREEVSLNSRLPLIPINEK